MTAFTPGPWKLFIDDSGGPTSGWPLSITAPETHQDKVVVRTGGQWPYEWDAAVSQVEAVANARLIAAAPAMHSFIQKRAAEGDAEAASILEAINAHS
jgi:hypothetical protein